MRLIIFVFLSLLFFLFFAQETLAKTLPQAKIGKQAVAQKSSGSGIAVSPKLRTDKKALVIYFANLQNAKSVSYTLTYKTNGQEEGAGGSLTLGGEKTATRELLFGTCSKNVCRYHTNLSDMRVEITYTTTNGKKFLKRYRIKI